MIPPTPKQKFNGYFVAVGLFFLVGSFLLPPDTIDKSDLTTKTIVLSRNCVYSKSRSRGTGVYELRAREAKALFFIDVAGRIASKGKSLDSLRAGDTLQVQYIQGHKTELDDDSKEIRVYGLQKADQVYFDIAGYIPADRKFKAKLAWIGWVASALLLLNGLTILKDNLTYILAGIGFVVFVVLRILGLA